MYARSLSGVPEVPSITTVIQVAPAVRVAWAEAFDLAPETATVGRMVAALRMLCFGGVSVLVCVPANLLLWVLTGREMSLGWMLALSLASLFLYGALSLLCQRLRGPVGWVAAPVGWVMLGLVPLIWPRAAEWLTAVPTVVFCLLAAAGITLYLMELRRFCRRPMEGGVSYAFR